MIKKILSLGISIMIILMTVSFAFSMSFKPVSAATTGCCVVDDAGNYCSDDSTQDVCTGTFYSGISCGEVQGQGSVPGPCERVTCLEEDGSCSANKYLKQCIDNGGAWDTKSVSDIDRCEPGCCQLVDAGDIIRQYQVTFGYKCEKDAEVLDIGSNFVPGECEILEEQLGCCVTNFGCDMTAKSECSGLIWEGGDTCSNFPNVCGNCGDYNIKKCYEGDVYLFNGCGEHEDTPFKNCDVNTQMCGRDSNDEIDCKDISCEIPLNFTTLNYDTMYLKKGEIGVQYKDFIGKVNMNDNYVIRLDNGESACIQYQGPGETHMVYTCDRGESGVTGISNFKGREYVCEYNKTTKDIDIKKNQYESCTGCKSFGEGEEGMKGAALGFVKFLSDLATLGGWDALNIEFWDYWIIEPGLCNRKSFCTDRGDCIYDDVSSWCVPKYPIDTYDSCAAFTNSKSGSPWSSDGRSKGVACQSVGRCKLDEDRPLSYLGATSVCLGDVVVGAAVDWAFETVAQEVLSDSEKDLLGITDTPNNEDVDGDNVEATDDLSSTDSPQNTESNTEADKAAAAAAAKQQHQTSVSKVKGWANSFNKNYLRKIIFPILKLGGIIDLGYVDDSIKFYFFGDIVPLPQPEGSTPRTAPFEYYGENYFVEYTGGELNEFMVAKQWLKEWWDGGAAISRMIMDRLKAATVNVVTGVILRTLGDEVLDSVSWLNPQKWFRTFVCGLVPIPGFQKVCENKYFFGFTSCLIITGVQQDSYQAGICMPKDYRVVGYNNCYLCNDDEFRPCTPDRCYALGTECGYENTTGTCDVNIDALENCGNNVNKKLTIETDLSKEFSVNYTATYYNLEIETSKSARCRYSDDPDVKFNDMTTFDDNDRAGLHHEAQLWVGDPLISKYKYFVQCGWSCSEEDWGRQVSPIYEVNIKKLPKKDEEPPNIIDSYPYPAQLLESATTVNMWVKADESLNNCKYSALDFEGFTNEAETIIGSNIDSGNTDEESAGKVVEDLLLGFNLLNPEVDMQKKSDKEFEVQLSVESGNNYAYSIVCEDKNGQFSRPKIMLFRVSNPLDVDIIEPKPLSSRSDYLKEIKATTGSKETDCKYSIKDKVRYDLMEPFITTGGSSHVTELPTPLKSGEHTLYVSCVDFDTLDIGTAVSQFTIVPDTTAPKLIRIIGGNKLYIETDEDTNCTFSEEGFNDKQAPMTNSGEVYNGYSSEHSLQITDSNVYYITCEDREGNRGKYTIYP